MKKLIAVAFIAASLVSGPGVLVTSSGALAQGCTADAPEAWFRPGGFCSHIKGGGSLSAPVDPGCDAEIVVESTVAAIVGKEKGERTRVAVVCDTPEPPELCASSATLPKDMKAGDRVRVALVDEPCAE
ncbi:MAG TPA: hypothetical protein PK286_02915 [Devosia sp.]|nr:hypothetical protein [Devosia sp.]